MPGMPPSVWVPPMAEAGGPLTTILITGGAGQVGLELLAASWPDHVRLHAPDRSELDLSDAGSVERLFASNTYAAVINAAAYTAVDRAEAEVAAAFAANALGPALLADATRAAGIPIIQVSTDYVFDGSGEGEYTEEGAVGPLGVYGASKLAGELAVLSGNPRSVVMRTAWVVSRHRSNFIKTMLRLAAERSSLGVVEDQHGCPTSAADIADALRIITLRMIEDDDAPRGVFHFVNAGSTTWAGLAREVFACSKAAGGPSAQVDGIPTEAYPTPARRPGNSRLATQKIRQAYGIQPRRWQDAIAEIVEQLTEETTR